MANVNIKVGYSIDKSGLSELLFLFKLNYLDKKWILNYKRPLLQQDNFQLY